LLSKLLGANLRLFGGLKAIMPVLAEEAIEGTGLVENG
jgi:hypothetical protein